MDASEYKEDIFGMLFLKRLSDQFGQERDALRAEYQRRDLSPALIERQLANPDKYDFFVTELGHWRHIRHLAERWHSAPLAQRRTGRGMQLVWRYYK